MKRRRSKKTRRRAMAGAMGGISVAAVVRALADVDTTTMVIACIAYLVLLAVVVFAGVRFEVRDTRGGAEPSERRITVELRRAPRPRHRGGPGDADRPPLAGGEAG